MLIKSLYCKHEQCNVIFAKQVKVNLKKSVIILVNYYENTLSNNKK